MKLAMEAMEVSAREAEVATVLKVVGYIQLAFLSNEIYWR